MDLAVVAGLVLAIAAIVVFYSMEGGDLTAILMAAPMILTIFGAIGCAVTGSTLPDLKKLPASFLRAFTARIPRPDEHVHEIVDLAGRARREGLLALEERVHAVEDPFLRRGLELVIDGNDPDELAEMLSTEIETKRSADHQAAKFFRDAGGYAPTIGIVGTVLSLVQVLGHLSDPAHLGEMIASAFTATLWGLLSANAFWLPLASRLDRISEHECAQMELSLEGIIAIQDGSSPRVVEQKLHSLLPPDTGSRSEPAAEAA